jgi:hypothetical protein
MIHEPNPALLRSRIKRTKLIVKSAAIRTSGHACEIKFSLISSLDDRDLDDDARNHPVFLDDQTSSFLITFFPVDGDDLKRLLRYRRTMSWETSKPWSINRRNMSVMPVTPFSINVWLWILIFHQPDWSPRRLTKRTDCHSALQKGPPRACIV